MGTLSLPSGKPFLARSLVGIRLLDRSRSILGSQPKHSVLVRPFGWCVTQACNADTTRQPSIDRGFHQGWCEECKRDCHVDLSHAAFFTGGNLLNIGNNTCDDFIELTPALSDGCHQRDARLRTNWTHI